MPDLKIYTESPEYNVERAEANLAAKKSSDRIDIFNNFLSERFAFNKMLDFLVDLTPQYLRSAETIGDLNSLTRVLNEEQTNFSRNRYKVPRYFFHEVPPIPKPLTKESFQEYIYFLTHLNIVYRNSSSLTSGIVSEILLYTHNVENEQFKPFRSAQTYNYLIKYYGFDKFQVSFARYLLLVMYQDGHQPDIDTINELLKICRVHVKRRALSSTYKVITRYLAVAKKHDIQVNLLTWNRVYDCIDNVLLKEHFVNKIVSVNLPVLKNLSLQILSDFCNTTRDPHAVENFVETDLRQKNWKCDPRIADKVLHHRIINLQSNAEFGELWNGLIQEVALDGVTLKTILNGIFANPNFSHRTLLALRVYVHLSQKVTVLPEVLAKLVTKICENEDNLDVKGVNSLVRKLVHIDAVEHLNLTIEIVEYESRLEGKKKPLPTATIPEHYKIMKRLTRYHLVDLEAKCIYVNDKTSSRKVVPMPWEPTTEEDKETWKQQKSYLESLNWTESDFSKLSLKPATRKVPERHITRYRKSIYNRITINHDINLVRKLERGLDQDIEQKMRERNIYCT